MGHFQMNVLGIHISWVKHVGNTMEIKLIKKGNSTNTRGILSKAWYSIDGKAFLVKDNSFFDGQVGYEPYSEVMASKISEVLDLNHVGYELMPSYLFPDITVFGIEHVSVCENFLIKDAFIRPFERYILDKLGEGPKDKFEAYQIFLPKIPLLKMLAFDAFIGNEDRHTYNLDIITSPNIQYFSTSIYDNGISLLSYVKDSELRATKYIGKFDRAKPFRTTHKTQIKLIDAVLMPRVDSNMLYRNIILRIQPILSILPVERAKAIESYLKWRIRYLEKVMG
ncbi:hypothetical protein EXW35_26530 [Bacillus mycoides]|uniref:hypothetical protein n=1 Tax=Bacillus mycoides TaxID=1405 RepID=UPI001C035335|nr:hypothetical protein [Bacillus mycoides]QWG41790.1 hypothetical protein EXW35_26530 [Bacillus mycoides]